MVDIVLEPRFDMKFANDLLAKRNVKARLVNSGVAYHILDSEVDKGVGLRKICEMSAFELDEIVAIGDNYNDIDMFQVAGYSIAVANAPKELKEKANFVCSKKFGKGFIEAVNHALSKFCST
jgi:hydroxymethylpyrimidine pyrophosphatase-like HAD family hydrolase